MLVMRKEIPNPEKGRGLKMLELPESCTVAKQMEEKLTGKTISHVEMLHTPHRFAFIKEHSEGYCNNLEGQTVTGACHHGGMAELDLNESMIIFADGAYPRYYDDKKKFPRKHQFAIYFDDETAVFVSIQMYGEIFIYPKGECTDGYYLSSSKKPEPLTEQFTFDYFMSLYEKEPKKMSAKAFLATNQRIPGLGNGVLQDILWDAGFDPRFDMKNMTDEGFMTLYDSVRKVLREMVLAGGRDTERDLFGEKGGYVSQLSKNSLYEPCMRCGHEIHKANYMGGTVYFCEQCQKR